MRWTEAHSTLQIKFVKVHNVESGKIRFVIWKLSAAKQHHHHDEQISHLYIYVLKACVERSWYNTLWRHCVPKIRGLLVTLIYFFGFWRVEICCLQYFYSSCMLQSWLMGKTAGEKKGRMFKHSFSLTLYICILNLLAKFCMSWLQNGKIEQERCLSWAGAVPSAQPSAQCPSLRFVALQVGKRGPTVLKDNVCALCTYIRV